MHFSPIHANVTNNLMKRKPDGKKKKTTYYFNSIFRATLWNQHIKFRIHPHLEKE